MLQNQVAADARFVPVRKLSKHNNMGIKGLHLDEEIN
jgi:hypothetical protein